MSSPLSLTELRLRVSGTENIENVALKRSDNSISNEMPADLITIHGQILTYFQSHLPRVEQYSETLSDLKAIYRKRPNSHLKQEIERLEMACRINSDFSFYLLESSQLVENYQKELRKPVIVNFLGDIEPVDTSVKDALVAQFRNLLERLGLAQFLTPPSNPSPTPVSGTIQCSNCRSEISSVTCPECGLENEAVRLTHSFKDSDRATPISKYKYDRRVHFRDCINQFQGKQNSSIDEKVYTALYQKIASHNLELSGETREQRFANVTKAHILMFLRDAGWAKNYEDSNLLYHQITGAKLDDISHLEEALMKDFDRLSDLYDEIFIRERKIDRRNFINTSYVLFQLLRRHKYPCKVDDFNILKTCERKAFHDDVCSVLFEKLGWNFSPIF